MYDLLQNYYQQHPVYFVKPQTFSNYTPYHLSILGNLMNWYTFFTVTFNFSIFLHSHSSGGSLIKTLLVGVSWHRKSSELADGSKIQADISVSTP